MNTIKDVARESGTSIATVSRVINGKSVREQNYIKVKAAMEKLDFTVNIYARGLKTQKTMIVGIVIPDFEDIYFMKVAKAIQESLYQHGYSVFLVDSNRQADREEEQVKLLMSKKVDGLILTPNSSKGAYLKKYADHAPIVLVDQLTDDFEADAVVPDNITCVKNAVMDMIKKGHRRIGFIGGQPPLFTVKERLEGYLSAHRELDMPIDMELVKCRAYTEECGYEFMKSFLDMGIEKRPTAVIATNYDLTKGAIVAVKEESIRIPEDVSFVGYDFEELAFLYNPKLSIIVESIQEIGDKVVEVLCNRMNHDAEIPVNQVHRVSPHLMRNGSVRALQ